MKATDQVPDKHPTKFKRTKIIATIGPSTHNYESVLALIKSGANGIRLNFSHGTHEERIHQIKWIRRASKEFGKPVAIIQDLQGPKIRLGDFEGLITVEKGQSLRFKYKSDYVRSGMIPTQFDLSKKVKRGQRVLLYDGKVETVVTSIKDGIVYVRAENDGVLLKRKGINLPDTDFGGDTITDKDIEDLTFGTTQDIDYVAQSFVQSSEDIVKLRRMLKNLGSTAKVVAKIETTAALNNTELIVQASDAVMVARGDLSVETAPEVVPIEQRRIVGLCRKHAKPAIIATQMLATMMESSEPTRAEVSDVATAAIIGADCVMLSDETANGRYPIEAVKIMKRIVLHAEKNNPMLAVFNLEPSEPSRQLSICSAVVNLSKEISATAIVAETKTGATASLISSFRPPKPIIAITPTDRVSNQLALVYGVKSYVRPDHKYAASKLTDWLAKNKALHKGETVVTASGRHPGMIGATDTIKIRVI